MALMFPMDSEWLETDGLGGFASGTISGERTRRYHALLLSALQPPTRRMAFVQGLDAFVDTPKGHYPLSCQRYLPDVVSPDGDHRIESFAYDPWPQWIYRCEDGTHIDHELFIPHHTSFVCLRWFLMNQHPDKAKLRVRPFLSGRDYHQLHHKNSLCNLSTQNHGSLLLWKPYQNIPGILCLTNARFFSAPCWYERFFYREEQARGLDCVEDLSSPGILEWDLSEDDAIMILSTENSPLPDDNPRHVFNGLRLTERKRRLTFHHPLERAADVYFVRRNQGQTLIAGYPWFTDWGRDTFIALRGLGLALKRYNETRRILLEWSSTISQGMLPNRFPDGSRSPEYNSVDASLWFIIVCHEFFQAEASGVTSLTTSEQAQLINAIGSILEGYQHGTRHGIHATDDGLLAAGEPSIQLTWMDAKVGSHVVTPRIGKPVEIQALWINALYAGAQLGLINTQRVEHAKTNFLAKFWDDAVGGLYDVVDVDHVSGNIDTSLRPNQVFALGGLPLCLLDSNRGARMLQRVADHLWTPLGLRSLAPGSPDYALRYQGNASQRDGSYHQGTVWPWLIGPFVEAWVRLHGNTIQAKREAQLRFLPPLLDHLHRAGLGHISEIADAEWPHTPRGCPFQAWSLGEFLRLKYSVLVESK